MTPRFPIRRPMPTPTPPAPLDSFPHAVLLASIVVGLLGVGIQLSGIKDAIRAQTAATAALAARPVSAVAPAAYEGLMHEVDRARNEAWAANDRTRRELLEALKP